MTHICPAPQFNKQYKEIQYEIYFLSSQQLPSGLFSMQYRQYGHTSTVEIGIYCPYFAIYILLFVKYFHQLILIAVCTADFIFVFSFISSLFQLFCLLLMDFILLNLKTWITEKLGQKLGSIRRIYTFCGSLVMYK